MAHEVRSGWVYPPPPDADEMFFEEVLLLSDVGKQWFHQEVLK